MGIPFQAGIQMVLDGQLNYTRAGLECFLRVSNFEPAGDWIEVGVPFVPTGSEAAATGFTDILILPPPAITDVSMHDIGLSGGRLNIGARRFFISDSFVQKILSTYPDINDSYNVWRNWDGVTASVVGLVYDGRLFSIEIITHREVAGRTVSWLLTCNALELPQLEGTAAEVEQP